MANELTITASALQEKASTSLPERAEEQYLPAPKTNR